MNTTEISRTAAVETVVRNYVDAIAGGRIEDAKALFATDASWTLIGSLPMSGTWHGHKGIFEDFLGLAFARIDATDLDLVTTSLIAAGDTVVVEWESHAGVIGGGRYDQHCIGVFTVRDGLITSVREYFDTDHARTVLFPAA
ncbi:nuclear transport factor 2 family protein [Streptacidiphilus sp. EB129]|uniref:nuclear transport factor 2 family protein n=1 Tax=Streptacidiphilus sp. EB129 TaxID=3156262 RepID=UPI003512EA03